MILDTNIKNKNLIDLDSKMNFVCSLPESEFDSYSNPNIYIYIGSGYYTLMSKKNLYS